MSHQTDWIVKEFSDVCHEAVVWVVLAPSPVVIIHFFRIGLGLALWMIFDLGVG